MRSAVKIVFVYNTDAGVLPELKDYGHKTVSHRASGCALLAVTWGPLGMKKEWKRYIHDMGFPVRFLHRDEFIREFGPNQAPFPAAFIQTGKTLQPLITADEMHRCRIIKDLMARVDKRLVECGLK